ncbi:hypothetical protein Dimus_022806 [Dionaea muscipula]
MSEADIDDQVLGSSAMHNDAGELRTDGHERDDSKKGKKTRPLYSNWVLQTIGVLWRNYKGRLKRDHYTPYETTKMRWKNRPEDVPDEDFKFLLKKWKDPKYKTRMEELQSQLSGKSGEDAESSCSVDPFLAIMGKEHNGRVRLHGRGVTPSNLGKASTRNESSSINVPNELLESIKVDVIAQVITELIANMMQTVISQTVSGDASSAPNHQSSVGLNGDSSIGANKTHFEVLRGDNSALANDITNVLAVVFHIDEQLKESFEGRDLVIDEELANIAKNVVDHADNDVDEEDNVPLSSKIEALRRGDAIDKEDDVTLSMKYHVPS